MRTHPRELFTLVEKLLSNVAWMNLGMGWLQSRSWPGLELQILRGTHFQGHSRRALNATILKNKYRASRTSQRASTAMAVDGRWIIQTLELTSGRFGLWASVYSFIPSALPYQCGTWCLSIISDHWQSMHQIQPQVKNDSSLSSLLLMLDNKIMLILPEMPWPLNGKAGCEDRADILQKKCTGSWLDENWSSCFWQNSQNLPSANFHNDTHTMAWVTMLHTLLLSVMHSVPEFSHWVDSLY